jgi:hypothetical protein
MSTTTNFFEALQSHVEPEKQKIFFRLYYNKKNGDLIEYSMEDLPGDYIEITAEQFAESNPYVYVKDGKIKKRKMLTYGKLVPSATGYPTHATDVSIVDPESTTFWDFKTYD